MLVEEPNSTALEYALPLATKYLAILNDGVTVMLGIDGGGSAVDTLDDPLEGPTVVKSGEP
jgi:hypothetical protein